jgi:uncharacterized protein YjbI with pentapeptide repeats
MRALEELPWAQFLEAASQELRPDGRYETVHFDASTFDEVDAAGARFLEVACSGVSFTGGSLRQAQLRDSWFSGVRWIGTDLAGSSWADVEVAGAMLAGAQLYDCELRRVTLEDSRLDSVNFRSANIRDVTFRGCRLEHVDFSGAKLTNVSFPGSALEGVTFERAELKGVDFTAATALSLEGGHEGLRGATISEVQLMDLAPAFAALLGVNVSG